MRVDPVHAPPCSGGMQPGTQALALWIQQPGQPWTVRILSPTGNGYNCRTIAGSTRYSLHADGRAYDVGCPVNTNGVGYQTTCLDPLARWLVEMADPLGIQEIVWNRQVWSPARGWHAYSGSSSHEDHLHFAQNDAGAALTPAQILAIVQPEEDPLPFTETELRKIVREETTRAADAAIDQLKLDTANAFGVNGWAAALVEAARRGDAKKDD